MQTAIVTDVGCTTGTDKELFESETTSEFAVKLDNATTDMSDTPPHRDCSSRHSPAAPPKINGQPLLSVQVADENSENVNRSSAVQDDYRSPVQQHVEVHAHVAKKWMLAEQTLSGCPKTPLSILEAFRLHSLRSLSMLASHTAGDSAMPSKHAPDGQRSAKSTDFDDDSCVEATESGDTTAPELSTGTGTDSIGVGDGTPAVWLSSKKSNVVCVGGAGTAVPPQQHGCYMKSRMTEVDRIVDLLADVQTSAVLNTAWGADVHHRFVESLIEQTLHATQKRLDTRIVPPPVPPSTAEASVQTTGTSPPGSTAVCRSPRQPISVPVPAFQQPKSPFNTTVITIGGTPVRNKSTGIRLGHSKNRAGTPQRAPGHNNDTSAAAALSGRPRVAQKSVGTSVGRTIGTAGRPLSRGENVTGKKQQGGTGGDNINHKEGFINNKNRSIGNLVVLGVPVDHRCDEGHTMDGEVTVVVPDNCTNINVEDGSKNSEKSNIINVVGVSEQNDTTNDNVCDDVYELNGTTAGTALQLSPVVALQPVELKNVDVLDKTPPADNVVVLDILGNHTETATKNNVCTGGNIAGTNIRVVEEVDVVVANISRNSENNGDEFARTAGTKVFSNAGARRLSGTKRSFDIATELALAAERGDRDALDKLIVAIQRNVPPVHTTMPPVHTNIPPVQTSDLASAVEIESTVELPDDSVPTAELRTTGRRRGAAPTRPGRLAAAGKAKASPNVQPDTEVSSGKPTVASTKIENTTGAATRLLSSRSCARTPGRPDSTGTDSTIAPPLSSRRARTVSQNSTTSNKSDVVKSEYTGTDTGTGTNVEDTAGASKGGTTRRKKCVTGGVPAAAEKAVATHTSARATAKATVKRVLKRRKVADDAEDAPTHDYVPNNGKRPDTKIEQGEACAGTPPQRAATRSKPRSKSGVAATPVAPVPSRKEVKASGGTPLKARLRRRRA